ALPGGTDLYRVVRHRPAGQGVAGRLRDRSPQTAADVEGGPLRPRSEVGAAVASPGAARRTSAERDDTTALPVPADRGQRHDRLPGWPGASSFGFEEERMGGKNGRVLGRQGTTSE